MDSNIVRDDAQDQSQPEQENPFAGIESEAYHDGERVETAEEPEESAAEEPEEAAAEEPDDGEEADDDSEDSSQEGEDRRPRRKQTFQERINELTRERREAERRAEALEAQLRALQQPNEPAAEPPTPQQQPPQPSRADAASEGGDSPAPPRPEDYEYGELDSRYISDLASYQAERVIEARLAEARQQAEEQEYIRRQQEYRERFESNIVNRGAEQYEDFYEKVVVGAERQQWGLTEDVAHMMLDSEVGHEIAYHLANNPDESARVYHMPPAERARWFGRMEARFSAGGSAATGSPVKTPPVKAPAAPPPVTQPRGATGRFEASPDTSDFAKFERMAEKYL